MRLRSGMIVKDGRVIALVLLLTSFILFYAYMVLAKRGKSIRMRSLPPIAALSEAIGRCAEMGKPLVWMLGIGTTISQAGGADTLAGISILGYVTKLAADAGVNLKIFTVTIDAMPLIEDTMKNSYNMAGKPEEYNPDSIELISNQSSLVSRYLGYVQRERPASACLIGYLAYESVVCSEAGNTIGALQVSGTLNQYQTPFLVASTDYSLIMEELYAASAEISGNPDSLGAIAGEDILKFIVLGIIVVGVVLALFRNPALTKILVM